MIIWHRSGWNGTTPRCRSLNIANSTFSEGRLQEIPRICRFADRASHPPCKKHCKYHVFMQNAAKRRFWDHTMGGGGGVVANREPGSYIPYIPGDSMRDHVYPRSLEVMKNHPKKVTCRISRIYMYIAIIYIYIYTSFTFINGVRFPIAAWRTNRWKCWCECHRCNPKLEAAQKVGAKNEKRKKTQRQNTPWREMVDI